MNRPEKGTEESGQSRIEQYQEFQLYTDAKQMAKTKLLGKDQIPSQSNIKKDDELVKHMSNLPAYLQQIQRGGNVKEKALNFGVLDWKRLERWNYDEKLIPARGIKNVSSSSNNSSYIAGGTSIISGSAKPKTDTSQRKRLSSQNWRPNSAYEEEQGVRSQRNVTKSQGHKTTPWSTLAMLQNLQPHEKISGVKYSEISLDGEKSKESDFNAKSEKATELSSSGKHESPSFSIDKDTETNTMEEVDLATQSSANANIVLILPKILSRRSFSEDMQLSKPRKSYDGNLAEAVGRRFSGSFSPNKLHSVEMSSEIPHFCPLAAGVATKVDSDAEQKYFVKPQGVEQFDESRAYQRTKNITIPTSDIEPLTIENPKRSGQDLAAKGRHLSPRRRFSFSSIGRMTKSFSFKEGLGAPQLSSSYATVKSGPVGSSTFAHSHKVNQDNESSGNRSRSSPLRRLLDPLLKPKGVHSTEFVLPSKINLDPLNSNPMDTTELLHSQTSKTSCVQALLQLTLKNGLPLFKLVVDNSSDIIAAAVKKLPTPEEDVPCLIYALYSVHEKKKKNGNWMSQGSKGKSSSLGYNVIGQIKVASSKLPGFSCQNTNDKCTVRESILYDVDIEQEDTKTLKFMPSKELAALVINNPNDESDRRQSDNSKSCQSDNFDKKVREDSNNTTVILPGGIHGLPNSGAPSPLMTRWRSGGSCDCGGWDVGCKLHILTNLNQISKNLTPLSSSVVEGLNLFVQGAHKDEKPIFSLAPFTGGVYSVDFDSSISLIQAFFIAVTFLSSQKLSNLFAVDLEKENLVEPTNVTIKIPTTIQGEAPTRYVINPPTSPVGRV